MSNSSYKSKIYYLILVGTFSIFCSLSAAKELEPNTYVGGSYLNYTGDGDNSLSGETGYGVNIISTPHRSHFRLQYGALVSYVDGRAYVASARSSVSMYSADALLGVSIYPITQKVKIRPFLEMGGLGGFKYLDITNPPAGVDAQGTGLSYGYRLAIGVETTMGSKLGLRMSADYISNKSNVANTSSFQFDAFTINLGFFF